MGVKRNAFGIRIPQTITPAQRDLARRRIQERQTAIKEVQRQKRSVTRNPSLLRRRGSIFETGLRGARGQIIRGTGRRVPVRTALQNLRKRENRRISSFRKDIRDLQSFSRIETNKEFLDRVERTIKKAQKAIRRGIPNKFLSGDVARVAKKLRTFERFSKERLRRELQQQSRVEIPTPKEDLLRRLKLNTNPFGLR